MTREGRFRVLADPREEDEEGWLFVDVDPPEDGGPEDRWFEPIAVPHRSVATDGLRPGYLVAATLDWHDASGSSADAGSDRPGESDPSGASTPAPTPSVVDLAVCKRTLFAFQDGIVDVFEAAETAWAGARATGDPVNSQVTYSTDGDPNGVLYVFADPPGRDVFEEFRTGARPVDPLVERVNEHHDGAVDRDSGPDPGPDGDRRGGRDETGEARTPTVAPDGSIVVPTPDKPPDRTADPTHPDCPDDPAPDREVFVMRPADGGYVIVYIALRKGGLLADTVRDTYHCPRPEEADADGNAT